jgi:hypothetical protein
MPTLPDKIQHVIVLMLENRAESNPSQWGEVAASDQADYTVAVGPNHTLKHYVLSRWHGSSGRMRHRLGAQCRSLTIAAHNRVITSTRVDLAVVANRPLRVAFAPLRNHCFSRKSEGVLARIMFAPEKGVQNARPIEEVVPRAF